MRRTTLAFGLLLGLGVALGVAGTFTLSRDAGWLRKELAGRSGDSWNAELQISAGRVLLGAARAVVRRLDDVDPQVRTVLDAVRRASVGIYTLDNGDTDAALASLPIPEGKRGWTRLVVVRGPGEVIAVYAKEPRDGSEHIDVTVAVQERQKVVIVSATVAPEGLVGLLARHAPRIQVAQAE